MTATDSLLLSILPLLALGCCCLQLRRKKNTAIRMVFVSLALLAFCQLLGYNAMPFSIEATEFLADLFLVTTYFLGVSLVAFAYHLSASEKNFSPYFYIIPALLGVFHFNGFFIDGYLVSNWAVMHIDGKYAYIIDFYQLGCLAILAGLICQNIRSRKLDRMHRSKNILILVSIVPAILALVFFVLLSVTQYSLSTTFFIPIVSIYMVYVFSYLDQTNVVDVTNPVSLLERISLVFKIVPYLLTAKHSKKGFEAITGELERQILQDVLKQHPSIKEAALAYGCDKSSLYKKIKLYGLESPVLSTGLTPERNLQVTHS